MAITNLINRALGAPSIQVFPKSQYKVIKQIADLLNSIILNGTIIRRPSTVAINATATATVDQILSGYITSTSAAATSITTPTATALATALGAVRGTSFDFMIDNSAGANTVTLVLDGSITVNTPAITGGAALTVSVANAIGTFRIVFTSTTAAKIFRIS